MALLHKLTIDITPLRTNRDYRLLFIGQFISYIGSAITAVALSYQIYLVTQSTAYVGLLGLFQLIPLSVSGFIGGSVADRFDRKKIIITSEIILTVTSLLLMAAALLPQVSVWVLFAISGSASLVNGFHRPALEAVMPRVIEQHEIPAASALSGFRGTTAMILGPSLAGVILASFGLFTTYLIDAATFVVSIGTVMAIRGKFQLERLEQDDENAFSLAHIGEGLRYAWSRKELLGTYFVDIMSMITSYPYPLFPALAVVFGGVASLGWLHASLAIGAFLATLTSGWTKQVTRHGKAITLAAVGWCVGILAAGFTGNLWLMLFFLGCAGFSDMVSAIFRHIIWNQTIPDAIRGRMVGIEMLSYMTGPLIGGTLMGFLAAYTGETVAMSLGGSVGLVGIAVLIIWLQEFWKFSTPAPGRSEPVRSEA